MTNTSSKSRRDCRICVGRIFCCVHYDIPDENFDMGERIKKCVCRKCRSGQAAW
ncbi:MAG: hypothetical protein MPK62_01605 [Alphaproteobacteria bacterium]|nr:hypothetical protein [Alphaproteobacteria bacterium]